MLFTTTMPLALFLEKSSRDSLDLWVLQSRMPRCGSATKSRRQRQLAAIRAPRGVRVPLTLPWCSPTVLPAKCPGAFGGGDPRPTSQSERKRLTWTRLKLEPKGYGFPGGCLGFLNHQQYLPKQATTPKFLKNCGSELKPWVTCA